MKQLVKDNHGYFTVEASLVVPMVLFCIFGVLLIGLYQYDLGTAETLLASEVVQISDVIKTDARNGSGTFKAKELTKRPITYLLRSSYPARASEGKKRLTSELQKRLIVSSVSKITVSAGQQKVTGKLQIFFRIPIPVISRLTGSLWKNNLTVAVENGSNAEQMRRWSQLE